MSTSGCKVLKEKLGKISDLAYLILQGIYLVLWYAKLSTQHLLFLNRSVVILTFYFLRAVFGPEPASFEVLSSS